jgi:hypothetical protein
VPSPTVNRRSAGLTRSTRAVLLTIAAVAACGESPAPGTPVTVRDSSGVTIVEQDLAQLTSTCTIGAQPTLSIGVEEGEPEYMLSGLFGAVRLSDGRIVLAQRSTHDIRYYDSTGTFLRASGRQGRGPGEFSDPFYLHVLPGDTVYAGDYDPWQFLVFDPDGNWVRSVSPTPPFLNSPSTRGVMSDGQLVLGREDRFSDGDATTFPLRHVDVMRFDADGTLRDTLGRFANGRYGKVDPDPRLPFIPPMFESFLQFEARDDRVVIGHASATELRIHRVDSAFTLERILRWNDGPRDITPEDIDAERATLAARYPDLAPAMYAVLVEPMVSAARPVAEQFPAFGQLHIGTDNRLWIREYPRPRADTTTYRWLAFQPDGTFACRLTTPRYNQFYEFGADYVLVRDADSLGVERVRQFPLRGP